MICGEELNIFSTNRQTFSFFLYQTGIQAWSKAVLALQAAFLHMQKTPWVGAVEELSGLRWELSGVVKQLLSPCCYLVALGAKEQ